MSQEFMRCARCRRPLLHPVMVADVALGKDCASKVKAAVAAPAPDRRAQADAAAAADFAARQLSFLETA